MVTEFTVSGHADAAEYGLDIVCSAATAVVFGALGSLDEMFGIDSYEDVIPTEDSDFSDDYVRFEMPDEILNDRESIKAIKVSAILDAMVIGLKQIELQYGENIKVTEREVRTC